MQIPVQIAAARWGIESTSITFMSSVIRRRCSHLPRVSLITQQIGITNFQLHFNSSYRGAARGDQLFTGLF